MSVKEERWAILVKLREDSRKNEVTEAKSSAYWSGIGLTVLSSGCMVAAIYLIRVRTYWTRPFY